MTTNAPAPISGDSCPTGITFGETITLSPSGETVTNPKTAYFNNGDYVVIWTEIKVTPPRLEFQLFNGTDNTKIACTTTPSCTGELIESLGTKRLGTSAVGVYEDYRFIIAWSTQENSYSPWVINIKAFKYNVADSNYQTTTFTKTIPNTQNHGIFGFATLSLDNGFVLSYMETAYKLITHIYKEKDNYQPQSLPSPEPVNASYKKEILIKAVPTQYFFSVVVSDLMDNRGIYIRNYRIDDGMKVCPVISTESDQCLDLAYLSKQSKQITPKFCYHYISSNPRGIFADLSYGGTLTVAWRDKEKDLDKQRNIRYKAQMFSDTASISQSFEISDKDDNSQNYDTYLRQVITQSQSRVIATFLKQEAAADKYIVKIFDNNGNLVESNYEALGSSTPSSPNRRAFQEMSDSGPTAPSVDCKKRQRVNTEGIDYVLAEDPHKPIERPEVKAPSPPECQPYKELKQVCGGSNEEKEKLIKLINSLKQILFLASSNGLYKLEPDNPNSQLLGSKTFLILNHLGKNFLFRLAKVNEQKNVGIRYEFNRQTYTYKVLRQFMQSNIEIDYTYHILDKYPDKLPPYRENKLDIFINPNFLNKKLLKDQISDMFTVCLSLRYTPLMNPKEKCITDAISYENSDLIVGEDIQNQLKKLAEPQLQYWCYKYLLIEYYSYIEACENIESSKPGVVCSSRKQTLPYKNDIGYFLTNTINQVELILQLEDLRLTEKGKALLNIQGNIIRKYLSTYLNGLKDNNDRITYYYAPLTCKTNDIAWTQLGTTFSVIAFCTPYLTQSKEAAWHTYTHEYTHRYLSTTDLGTAGNEIYGNKDCYTWAIQHPPFDDNTPSSLLIADCVALFITTYDSISKKGTNFQIQQDREEQMYRREDVLFTITAHASSGRVVTTIWKLDNQSPNDYYIESGVLHFGGLHSQQFYIQGPSSILCHFTSHEALSNEGYILLKSNHFLFNEIVISNYCSFDTAVPGVYIINVHGSYNLYTSNTIEINSSINEDIEFSWLLGRASFVIGENPEDLALTSLSYESGL